MIVVCHHRCRGKRCRLEHLVCSKLLLGYIIKIKSEQLEEMCKTSRARGYVYSSALYPILPVHC